MAAQTLSALKIHINSKLFRHGFTGERLFLQSVGSYLFPSAKRYFGMQSTTLNTQSPQQGEASDSALTRGAAALSVLSHGVRRGGADGENSLTSQVQPARHVSMAAFHFKGYLLNATLHVDSFHAANSVVLMCARHSSPSRKEPSAPATSNFPTLSCN